MRGWADIIKRACWDNVECLTDIKLAGGCVVAPPQGSDERVNVSALT
jgi:hypothetical protein